VSISSTNLLSSSPLRISGFHPDDPGSNPAKQFFLFHFFHQPKFFIFGNCFSIVSFKYHCACYLNTSYFLAIARFFPHTRSPEFRHYSLSKKKKRNWDTWSGSIFSPAENFYIWNCFSIVSFNITVHTI
jgi:hypothetical protein